MVLASASSATPMIRAMATGKTIDPRVALADVDTMQADVADMKSRADVVIVSMHQRH